MGRIPHFTLQLKLKRESDTVLYFLKLHLFWEVAPSCGFYGRGRTTQSCEIPLITPLNKKSCPSHFSNPGLAALDFPGQLQSSGCPQSILDAASYQDNSLCLYSGVFSATLVSHSLHKQRNRNNSFSVFNTPVTGPCVFETYFFRIC